jgi:hypothetical protein
MPRVCDSTLSASYWVLQVGAGIKLLNITRLQVGAGIKLLNITRLTMPRRDAHPGPGGSKGHGMDCTHFCLPGLPDDWNRMFLASLPGWMAENERKARKGEL